MSGPASQMAPSPAKPLNRHIQESGGPLGPKSPKSLQGLPGPLGPECQKSAGKVPKDPKKSQKGITISFRGLLRSVRLHDPLGVRPTFQKKKIRPPRTLACSGLSGTFSEPIVAFLP